MKTTRTIRNFVIQYRWTKSGANSEWQEKAASPLEALEKFHTYMQAALKLAPGAYQLTGFFDEYYATGAPIDAHSPVARTAFDVPKGPNPVITARSRPAKDTTTTFPFLDDVEFLASTKIHPHDR